MPARVQSKSRSDYCFHGAAGRTRPLSADRLPRESVRAGRAADQEATVLAHKVLLASLLAEAGHGLLDRSFVRQLEEAVLTVLDTGKGTGDWIFSEAIAESLRTKMYKSN
jgi:hypothetical protein